MLTPMKGTKESPMNFKVYFFCMYACFGGILFGYDSGYINGILAMNQFKKDFGHPDWPSSNPEAYNGYLYDSWQKSIITSILSAGTLVGSLVSGYFADWCGRKTSIVIGCVIYIAGVALQTAAQCVGLLSAGRAVAGVGVGFVSATVIMYVSEITPHKIRGRVVGSYQFAITLGLLLSSCVAYATKSHRGSGAYRIPIGLQFVWALILALGLLYMPESPRWYVMKERDERARKSLAILRAQPQDSVFVEIEHEELKRSWRHETNTRSGSGGWLDCFEGGFKRGSNLHRTFIGTTIQMMQQLTGVNFIFYFGTTFFKGIGINDSFKISIITAVVNAVSTPVAFWTIDKLGRRPLLIWGAVGMCICEFIVAIVGVTTGGHPGHIVLILFVCVYIFFFACTWGPTGWAVSGEIFPLSIRSKGIALSTASNWLWNFIISFATPYIVDKDKGNLNTKVFFIWGATCFTSALFSYLCVYETKGLSLEQVDKMMSETTARCSARWKPGPDVRGKMDIEKEAELTPEMSPTSSGDSGQRSWGTLKLGINEGSSVKSTGSGVS